jgi:hypothetical protein
MEDSAKAGQEPVRGTPREARGRGARGLTKGCALFAPLVSLVLLVALTGCGWGEARSVAEREDAFKEVMGFDASPDVCHISSYYYWVRDSYSRWLKFECSDATIGRIEKLQRDTSLNWDYANIGPGDREQGNPNAPSWWMEGPADLKGFTVNQTVEGKLSDFTHITVDHKNHRVYAVRDILE